MHEKLKSYSKIKTVTWQTLSTERTSTIKVQVYYKIFKGDILVERIKTKAIADFKC